jgi:hypothetical protein
VVYFPAGVSNLKRESVGGPVNHEKLGDL